MKALSRVLPAVLVWCAAAPGFAANWVVNGDFETGDLTGWTKTTPEYPGFPWQAFTGAFKQYPMCVPYAGNYALGWARSDGPRNMAWNNPRPGIYQDWNVTQGQTYDVLARCAAFMHNDRAGVIEDFWGLGLTLLIRWEGNPPSVMPVNLWKHDFWPTDGDSFWRYYDVLTNQVRPEEPNRFTVPTSYPLPKVRLYIYFESKWHTDLDMVALDDLFVQLTPSTGNPPVGSNNFVAKDPPSWSAPLGSYDPTEKSWEHWPRQGAVNGGDQFVCPTELTVGLNPSSVCTGDFNGDGRLDAAVCNEWSHTVSILLGQPSGKLAWSSELSGVTTPGAGDGMLNPRCVRAGKLVGNDNYLDLAVACNGSNKVFVFRGDGAGHFGNLLASGLYGTDTSLKLPAGPSPWPLAIGDFDNDGKNDIAVADVQKDNENLRVFKGDGMGTFTQAYYETIPAEGSFGPRYVWMETGDFGGTTAAPGPDGKLDLLLVAMQSNAVRCYRGNGDCTFAKIGSADTGTNPMAALVGELENLILTGGAALGLDCLPVGMADHKGRYQLGMGNCEFVDLSSSLNKYVEVGAGQASCIVGPDLNNDGHADSAVSMWESSEIAVTTASRSELIANGGFEGGFTGGVGNGWTGWSDGTMNAVQFSDSTDVKHSGAHAQKFGRADAQRFQGAIAQSVSVTSGEVYDLSTWIRFSAADSSAWLAIGYDPTGQTSNPLAGTVSYTYIESFPQNQWFNPGMLAPATSGTMSVFVLFGQDGQTSGPNWVWVDDVSVAKTWLNCYGAPKYYPTGDTNRTLAYGDFNNDGYTDFLVPGSQCMTVATIYGGPNQSFKASKAFDPSLGEAVGATNGHGLCVADFNRDGKLDFVVGHRASNADESHAAMLFVNQGDGEFVRTFRADVGAVNQDKVLACDAGDFNNDNKPDFAAINNNDNTSPPSLGKDDVVVFLGDGAGGFTSVMKQYVGTDQRDAVAADFNNDGKLDLAVVDAMTGSATSVVRVMLNDGSGDLSTNQTTNLNAANPKDIAMADFNGDGKKDVLVAEFDADQMLLLTGKGDGTFNAPVAFTAGDGPTGICVADLNGDGKTDAIVTNYNSNTVSVFLGTGAGSFGAASTVAVGRWPVDVQAADFNRDNKLDLVVLNQGEQSWSYLRGNGDGTFQTAQAQVYRTAGWPRRIAAADFRGTGAPDVLIANSGSARKPQIYQNTGATPPPPVQVTKASDAKKQADGTTVQLSGQVVSRIWSGSPWVAYVQDTDRSSGIRVEGTGTAPVSGDRVTVTGTMASLGPERMISGTAAVTGHPGDPAPLASNNRSLGGGSFQYDPGPPVSGQIGVLNGYGVNNIGLLVRTSGTVTRSQTGEGFFYVDDGSALDDGSGLAIGVRCIATGLTKPAKDAYVVVTGDSSVITVGSQLVRCLRVQRQTDIVTVP